MTFIDNEYFPLHTRRQLCDLVKYIAALLVVNGHLFLFGNVPSEVSRFMNLGAACVALFFFFSGYGLICSYMAKRDAYLKTFLRHRLLKVLLPLVVAYAVTLPFYAVFRNPIDIHTLLTTLSWGGPYLKFSWFVTEIVCVYILFYLVMKTSFSLKVKLGLLSVLIFGAMTGLMITKQPMWYSVSLPGFIIGLWYCYCEEKIGCFLHGNFAKIFTAVFFVLWFFTWQWGLLGEVLLPQYRYAFCAAYLSNIFFVCFIAGGLAFTRFIPPYLILTSSSYETYLLQNCAVIIASGFVSTFAGYWILAMGLAVILGFCQYRLDKYLFKLL